MRTTGRPCGSLTNAEIRRQIFVHEASRKVRFVKDIGIPDPPAWRAGCRPAGGDPRDGGGITMNDLPGSEFPSRRADVELVREKTGIHLEGSAGPVKAKVQVTMDGSARSPASVAVTMLLLVTTSCISALLLGTVGWLIHGVDSPCS